MTGPNTSLSLSRRAVLAGAAASTAATGGCVSRLQSVIRGSQISQLSLEIKTLPADSDPFSIRIARHLKSNLEAVGIDVRLTVMAVSELSRQVLLNHDFDIYIGQFPHTRPPDPDVLYPLLRSTFNSELGWQNPFGFTHLTCDEYLESQRSSGGEARQQAVTDLQQLVARTQPFTPLVFPDIVTGVRTDRFENWDSDGPTQPHNLLTLDHTEGEPRTLRLVDVDNRITTNRNPISAAYQQEESLLDLVYDSLALNEGSEFIPWLAQDITWVDSDGEEPPEVSIRLRDGLQWHDGETLTAYDVGFSYEFLRDTSLGSAVRPIPSERFRGRISLIDDVTVDNSRELILSFTDTTQPVARRALTVPILPAHIWRYRTTVERPVDRAGQTTAALTWNNPEAIGSGPLQFVTADPDQVEFSRFENHFLWRSLTPTPDGTSQTNESTTNTTGTVNQTTESTEQSSPDNGTSVSDSDTSRTKTDTTTGTDGLIPRDDFAPPPEDYAVSPAFDTVTIQTVSSDNGAIELLTAGDVDATVTNLSPEAIDSITGSNLESIENRSNAFYHLGFNTRRRPLRNPNVRRLVAQLVDKSMLAEESFGGYGVPAASPLVRTDWLADSLAWDTETDTDPQVPFIGTDGQVDVEDARERFRSIGYRFTNDNELISQIR